jgi:chromate transporter
MTASGETRAATAGPAARIAEVLTASLLLGLTSFGGPIAHLGYFERAYVRQRKWLTSEEYSGLVALCQMLPGPASSQVGFLIGLHRAGWAGAIAAWLGFTLPSALLLFACAVLSARAQGAWAQAALHGLKLVAVAVVAQAVWSMARRLCPDRATKALALGTACLLLVVGGTTVQLLALALGAAGGVLVCRGVDVARNVPGASVRPAVAWSALAAFVALLIGLPLIARAFPHGPAALADIFYRAGALVFGGGHVVLPLLRDALVPAGWLSDDAFLAGYGLAQAVPGPLFTVAAYLGAANAYAAPSVLAAAVALVFIFLPGLLIATAGVALWGRFAAHARVRAGLAGVNASVVGILGAALYDPVWTSAVHGPTDAAIAIVGAMLLGRWNAPPIVVVVLCVGAAEVAMLLR